MKEVKLWYQSLAPIEVIPKVLNSLLDDDANLLILAAYPAGTVGQIYFSVIERATQMKVPVLSIRQSMTDGWFYEWDGKEVLPGRYLDEVNAIRLGLIPLQKDLLRRDEVILGVRKIASQHTDYNTIVGTAMKRFSSDAFNRRLNEIREEYNLEPILFEKF